MSVEYVDYIGDFQTNLPAEIDTIIEGAEHLRNLKKGLINSFPNFNAPLIYTNTELNGIRNYLSGDSNKLKWTGAKPTKFSNGVLGIKPTGELKISNELLPVGSIVAVWSDPTKWVELYKYGPNPSDYHFNLCNGNSITGTKLNKLLGVDPYTLPDLRTKYPRQAKDEANILLAEEDSVKTSDWTIPVANFSSYDSTATTNVGGTNHTHNSGAATKIHYSTTSFKSCIDGNANSANYLMMFPGLGGAGSLSVDQLICTSGAQASRILTTKYFGGATLGWHTHQVTTGIIDIQSEIITNGEETCPDSICMNYYIRID